MPKLVLNTWGTPNGLKPILMLEELGVPYELVKVNIGKGEQNAPAFHQKNKNERIPVLDTEIDGKPASIAESAAILIHLADTNGGRFFPKGGAAHAATLQWLFFQMSAQGPMLGQLGYWKRQKETNQAAIDRYLTETKRIYGVYDERLGEARFLAGDEYSIADICTFFWARSYERLGLSIDGYPNVKRWISEIEAREAAKKTLAITWP